AADRRTQQVEHGDHLRPHRYGRRPSASAELSDTKLRRNRMIRHRADVEGDAPANVLRQETRLQQSDRAQAATEIGSTDRASLAFDCSS
ncbi:hypothetical protein, partial [Nevskia sp.]|uniref:hypothetical protein n=1 Tax=Nevskia sp. TaxID=1929292 RepID=UPI0025FF8D6F